MTPHLRVASSLMLAALLAVLSPVETQAQAVLSGLVTSAEEGPMEGVLVTARRQGAKFAVTVVTDARGVYNFPAGRLTPGFYSLQIRAVGHELEGPATADVTAAGTATADLKLRKASDLTTQLTGSEWLMSWPGTDQQKEAVYSCTNCHSVERIAKSKHDAEQFLQVFAQMAGYANMTTDTNVQKRVTEPNPGRFGAEIRNTAAYLASVNLSATPEWKYPLKTLPRIKGRGTRAIVTEYDLPRKEIQPHDVLVDADGMVWYSNFGELNLGRFNPKTGELKEYPLPLNRPGYPQGQLDLEFDADGNLWMGLMYQAGIAKFDKKSETMRTWYLPAERIDAATQINQVAVNHSAVDGKIWATDVGISGIHRLDLGSGRWETFDAYAEQPKSRRRGIYQVVADSQNNAWFSDYAGQDVGRIDAKTGNTVTCSWDAQACGIGWTRRRFGHQSRDACSNQEQASAMPGAVDTALCRAWTDGEEWLGAGSTGAAVGSSDRPVRRIPAATAARSGHPPRESAAFSCIRPRRDVLGGNNRLAAGLRIATSTLLAVTALALACKSEPAAAAQINIVVLGASNTYGKGVARGAAFPAQLQAMLKARGHDVHVGNAGINGDTTAGMLRRLDSAVPAGTRIVILQPGNNDRRKGVGAERAGNIGAIVDRLQARGVKVIVVERLLAGLSQHLQPDGEHLTAEGFRVIAERLVPQVEAAIGGH